MSQDTKTITLIAQNGTLRSLKGNGLPIVDGTYELNLDSRLSPVESLGVPEGLTSSVKLMASLEVLDTFTELLGFVSSLRASGHLVIHEIDALNIITLEAGIVTHFSQQSAIPSEPESVLRDLIQRLLTPTNGVVYWCEAGPERPAKTLNLPLEYLLLDTIRCHDEDKQDLSRFVELLPANARLAPNLDTHINQDLVERLRTDFGLPPYLVRELQSSNLTDDVLKALRDAVRSGTLVVERHHEVTTPPHLSANFDVDRVELQNLVSRFNHVLRRLMRISKWDRDELQQQLVVFGQFYGYQSVFDGVRQLSDGALDPLPLIENAMKSHTPNTQRFKVLAEALQELVFFELSSARQIDAKERRTLMSMTTQLVASSLNSKRGNVA